MLRIIATGGTIQNTPAGRVSVGTVLDSLAQYDDTSKEDLAGLEIHDLLREGSQDFTPNEWLSISQEAIKCVDDPDVSGVIVSHGTFTAEETAYFLHLTVNTTSPIVVVCAQRKHTTLSNDGDRNLLDAIRVARCSAASGKGAVLVMNEEIHSAREVLKSNQRPGGFVSGKLGLLGSIERDQVSFYRQPFRRHTWESEFDGSAIEALPRVDIVATYPGADGAAIRAFRAAGAEGLVVMGFAYSGKPHHWQESELEDAVNGGTQVVLTSRGGGGRVPRKEGDKFIRGDNLSAHKARLLLSLALTKTRDPVEIQRIFDEY